MYSYPYRSALYAKLASKPPGNDYRKWQAHDIQARVSSITNPVIEIGGPTPGGFYFLEGISFNTEPIITNISLTPLPLSHDSSKFAKQVDEIMDATKMPYPDNSIGIFLMSAMSVSSDWWVELTESEKEKASDQFEAEFANARFEMGQVAAGITQPTSIKDAQRVKIYIETARCLQKGGLFFTDGGIEEITILRRLGFEPIASLQVTEGDLVSYEFVVAKQF